MSLSEIFRFAASKNLLFASSKLRSLPIKSESRRWVTTFALNRWEWPLTISLSGLIAGDSMLWLTLDPSLVMFEGLLSPRSPTTTAFRNYATLSFWFSLMVAAVIPVSFSSRRTIYQVCPSFWVTLYRVPADTMEPSRLPARTSEINQLIFLSNFACEHPATFSVWYCYLTEKDEIQLHEVFEHLYTWDQSYTDAIHILHFHISAYQRSFETSIQGSRTWPAFHQDFWAQLRTLSNMKPIGSFNYFSNYAVPRCPRFLSWHHAT